MKIDNGKLIAAVVNAGFSMKELAQKAGLQALTISKICNGNNYVRVVTLGKLSKALGVSANDLLLEE